MSHDNARNGEFEKALARLEGALLVPVVPGELRSWCRAVGQALSPLKAEWERSRRRRRGLFDEIERQDPDIVRRVEQLAADDRRLDADLRRLASSLEDLLTRDAEAPQESKEHGTDAESLRRDLLQWVLACRMLETEVDTWFIEAHYRDRGTGD